MWVLNVGRSGGVELGFVVVVGTGRGSRPGIYQGADTGEPIPGGFGESWARSGAVASRESDFGPAGYH